MNMNFFKSTQKQLLSLQLGLTHFGLQPVDWNIIRQDSSRFVIQNKDESDFYFIGEVKKQNHNDWNYIRLAGL